MATMAEIRQGLANNLSTIDGVQVSAYLLAAPTPPAIQIVPASIMYDAAMHRGHDVYIFTVTAFVSLGLDQAAQMSLDALLAPSGATSVKAAIESDRTLGGKVADLRATTLSAYQVVTLADNRQGLSANWTVEVRG